MTEIGRFSNAAAEPEITAGAADPPADGTPAGIRRLT
tara:strand:- start:436 stop:546 length:111 start_codon:yes stop_codon:yes gene_type:complete